MAPGRPRTASSVSSAPPRRAAADGADAAALARRAARPRESRPDAALADTRRRERVEQTSSELASASARTPTRWCRCPGAAAWAWPSAVKGVEERERRIRQALEDAKARDYAVEKAAGETAKKLKQQQADDNGTQALVRELAATARREADLSVGPRRT